MELEKLNGLTLIKAQTYESKTGLKLWLDFNNNVSVIVDINSINDVLIDDDCK